MATLARFAAAAHVRASAARTARATVVRSVSSVGTTDSVGFVTPTRPNNLAPIADGARGATHSAVGGFASVWAAVRDTVALRPTPAADMEVDTCDLLPAGRLRRSLS